MECVVDSSSLSWLERVNYLTLLPQVYKKIIAPPGVLRQLTSHYPTQVFIQQHIIPLNFSSTKDKSRFYRLTRRWRKKVGVEDIVDAEVFVGYRFFSDTNEALYANKEAKQKFGSYGNARDIADLFELGEGCGIFNRQESIQFLEKFLEADYNTRYVAELLKKLRP